jgi:hypothetical protein
MANIKNLAPRSGRLVILATLVVLANLFSSSSTAVAGAIGTGYPASITCNAAAHTMDFSVSASAAPGLESQQIAGMIWIWDRVQGAYILHSQWVRFTHTLHVPVTTDVGTFVMNNAVGNSISYIFSMPVLPPGYYNVVTVYSFYDDSTKTWTTGNSVWTEWYHQTYDPGGFMRRSCVTAE